MQLLAVDRAQAEIALRYVKAFFQKPLLAPMLTRETEAILELNNGLAIEIVTADRRRARGRTVFAPSSARSRIGGMRPRRTPTSRSIARSARR